MLVPHRLITRKIECFVESKIERGTVLHCKSENPIIGDLPYRCNLPVLGISLHDIVSIDLAKNYLNVSLHTLSGSKITVATEGELTLKINFRLNKFQPIYYDKYGRITPLFRTYQSIGRVIGGKYPFYVVDIKI